MILSNYCYKNGFVQETRTLYASFITVGYICRFCLQLLCKGFKRSRVLEREARKVVFMKSMKRSMLLACVLVATSACAFATSANDNAITVTATRTEQLVKDVPSDMYVVTRQDIEENHYGTLQDALRMVPGVQFSTDPHGAVNVTVRGADARHTLVLIDGERIPTELTKTRANVASYSRINMQDVERIEVLSGSSSALYGSEAMGGVINIITKDQKEAAGKVGFELTKRHTTDSTGYKAFVGYNSGWKNNVKFDVYAEKNKHISSNHDGYQATFDGPRTPIRLGVEYKITPNDKVKVSYNHVDEDLRQIGFGIPGSITSKDVTSSLLSFQYDGKHGDTDMMTRYYVSDYKDFYHMGAKMGPREIHEWDRTKRKDKVFEVQFNTALNDQHLLTVGGEYRVEEGVGTRILTNDKIGTETHYKRAQTLNKAKLTTKSVYIQDMYTSEDEKLIIVPALRLDSTNLDGSRFSPKIGVTYKAKKDLRFKANYGTGFSTPGFTERYHAWQMFGPRGPKPGFYWEGNPNLKPETSRNFDVSVEKDFDKGSVKLTYFNNRIDNYITYAPKMGKRGPVMMDVPGGKNMVFTYFNLNTVTLKGATLDAKYSLNDNWDLDLSYTHLNTSKDGKSVRLPDKARKTIKAGISYHNKEGWYASFTGSNMLDYATYEDGPVDPKTHAATKVLNLSDFIVWNFLVSKDITKDTNVYFGIDNVFGKYYENRDTDGRSYHIGVTHKF